MRLAMLAIALGTSLAVGLLYWGVTVMTSDASRDGRGKLVEDAMHKLRAGNAAERRSAIVVLAGPRHDVPRLAPVAEALATDESAEVRSFAAFMLCQAQVAPRRVSEGDKLLVLASLLKALRDDQSAPVRLMVAEFLPGVLVRWHHSETADFVNRVRSVAVPGLEAALQDPDARVREAVAEAVRVVGNQGG